jgi:bifunctional non-homologous end joining protein LigD
VAKDATWVRPEMRIAAEIAEFTNDGLVRHASFVHMLA